ncbi:MAG: hypothetical protein ACK41D_12025 [Rubricoccaceae bacterium]
MRPFVLLALCLALSGCRAGDDASGLRRALLELPDEGQDALELRAQLALGRVRLAEAEAGTLFQAEARLPEGMLAPTLEARTEAGPAGRVAHATLRLDGEETSLRELRRGEQAAWTLSFSRRTPLRLALELGAADAALDFSGVPLERLTLGSGLARTRVVFAAPNPAVLDTLRVRAGLAAFSAEGLGYARAQTVLFDGGAGRFRLDFSGTPPRPGARVRAGVGLADLTIVVPDGHPVVVVAPHSSVTSLRLPEGFVGDGEGRFSSPGTSPADSSALRVRLGAGPGRIRVQLAR